MISGFVLTIIFIISTHFISSPSRSNASFSSLCAFSKFMNKTPTNKFMKKKLPTNTNPTKKYALIIVAPSLGPFSKAVMSV